MKAYNLILKKEDFEIYSIDFSSNKGVKITISATNPFDGKEYRKYAGWIGPSLALHGGSKTPYYIFQAASEQIARHKDEIGALIINFMEQNGRDNRAQEFRKAAGGAAGKGESC